MVGVLVWAAAVDFLRACQVWEGDQILGLKVSSNISRCCPTDFFKFKIIWKKYREKNPLAGNLFNASCFSNAAFVDTVYKKFNSISQSRTALAWRPLA